jgi:hypothetical protein
MWVTPSAYQAAEGSTNWSSSCEGTFVVTGKPGGPGYQAQNNTQSIITDPDTIIRFQTSLIAEHMTAQAQQQTAGGAKQNPPSPAPAKKTAAKKTAPKKQRRRAAKSPG